MLTEAQMASHTHQLRALDEGPNSDRPDGSVTAVAEDSTFAPSSSTLAAMAPEALSSTGGSQAHGNMQPFLTLNFIIALVGLYPSRS
jgi:microcystin-dependent protein